MAFFGLFKKHDLNDVVDSIRIKESQAAFEQEAFETINMTHNITSSLKDKLDDYENQIESMSHLMSDGLFMTDENGRITDTNRVALEMFKISEHDIRGMSIVTLFRLPEFYTFSDFVKDSINTTQGIEEDFEVTLPDGTIIYTDVSIATIHRHRNPSYNVIIVRDITERILSYRKIYESEQRIKIIEATSMESLVFHDNMKILDCNQQFLDLIGHDRENVVGNSLLEFVDNSERERVISLENSTASGKIGFEIICGDGEKKAVSMISRLIPWNGDLVRINILHDISIYKSETKLHRDSSERYESILNNNVDIVCCYNKDLIITYVNRTFEEYYSTTSFKVVGRSILDFIPSIDHGMFLSNIDSISANLPVKRSLYRVCVDGKERWQDWIDRGIIDEHGEIVEFQSVSRDVTNYLNARIARI